MKQSPDINIINQTLEKICSDELFKRSNANEQILRFLVQEAIAGNYVKEQTIGLELYKDDYSADKNESKIRVAIYSLRKKLEQYYADAGKNDAIIFDIEKGQYNLKFIDRAAIEENTEVSARYIKFKARNLVISVIVILLVVVPALIFDNIEEDKFCWNNFFKAGASNICVVSDHFIARELSFGKSKYILLNDIKSEEDLIIHNKLHPDRQLELSHFTLLSKMAPLAVQDLSVWFTSNGGKFTLLLESEMRIDDLNKNNIVFIGQAKNMVVSQTAFLQKSKKFKFEGGKYIFNDGNKIKRYEPKTEGNFFTDYAMVSYASGSNNNELFFITSEHDIGVMATVEKFTDAEKLKSFFDEFPDNKKYFNALFEVKGANRADMTCKLVEIEFIEKDLKY